MKHTKFLLGALLALVCLLYTTPAQADEHGKMFAPESWVLSLGGSGGSTTSGDSANAFGATIDFGTTGHMLLPLQGGVRQSITYGDSEATGSTTLFDTKFYLDATLFTIAKKVDFFAGGNFGLQYGNTPLTWTAAPEGGVRWWIKKDVAVVGRVDYPFDLNNGRAMNVLNYFLGLQIKL